VRDMFGNSNKRLQSRSQSFGRLKRVVRTMSLNKSDFWPPLQGGWEKLDGTFVGLEDLMIALGALESAAQEAIKNDDDGELSDLLEELFDGKDYPVPERVVWLSQKRIKDAPYGLRIADGYYAYWPTEIWESASSLAGIMRGCNLVGSVSFSYKYSRFIPAGADAVIWLAVLVGVVLWLLFVA
jgi:hypothetical protein